ncbi:Hypothetical predicted protein [Olea europaea subsp. europaea]|uniref:Uncharacterized protein n=1 Tax=Olea europaea subsp. europaea TaxID=158383 RepID=A0A8S0RUN4_OLEEU|nr:Hypothetical predicted protein [Olea europaea subsp. europaea]
MEKEMLDHEADEGVEMNDKSRNDENLKAEKTWFGQRDNRLCEKCGKIVTSNFEDTSIFMMEWDGMRLVATTLDTS